MSALSRSLVTPNKLASVLDWRRKAVMALDINENQVGISIGRHPSQAEGGSKICRLDPVRLSSSSSAVSHEKVAEHIDSIAKEHNVCAVVVGWPLQPEGNPGKPCGKVLHTLENLMERKSGIVSKRRPFTLWDDRHVEEPARTSSRSNSDQDRPTSRPIQNDQPPDQWGRCVAFARAPTSGDGETYCSQEAYDRRTCDGSEKASGILEHFLGSVYDRPEPSVSDDYRKVTNDSWDAEEALL